MKSKFVLLLALAFAISSDASAQIVTNISFLRSLLDPVNFAPNDRTNYYQVEGIVTTHTNLTTGTGLLFYFQDTNAGIAAFMTNGSTNLPRAGSLVRVTGRLTSFRGLLQFGLHSTNINDSILVLSSNNPLPAPIPFDYAWESDPAIIEQQEGKLVVVSNVVINATGTFGSGVNYGFTDPNTFQTNVFRVNATVGEIIGQPIPSGLVNIVGVLGQFTSSTQPPFINGYQIIPTRLADIEGAVRVPVVRFTNVLDQLVRPGDQPTNTFAEHALRPGERLRMTVNVFDLSNLVVNLAPVTNNLPTNAFWTLSSTNGTNLTALFTYQPTAAQIGSNLTVELLTSSSIATNLISWNIYTPTTAEQQLIITEFLANPSGTNTSPGYDPLLRPSLSDSNRFQNDEFIEIVNLNATNFPLGNWTLQDALSNRHAFFPEIPEILPGEQIAASNSIIVFGGPFGTPPGGPIVNAVAASEGSLALNNDGDSIRLRNPDGRLVMRVVYTAGDVDTARNSSLSRYPTLNDGFVRQSWIANSNNSAAAHYYGGSFASALKLPVPVTQPLLSLNTNGGLLISWAADTNVTQTIWRSETMTNRFSVVTGFKPTNTTAFFTDNTVTNTNRIERYFQIVTPPTP